jgi:hypothetical protein
MKGGSSAGDDQIAPGGARMRTAHWSATNIEVARSWQKMPLLPISRAVNNGHVHMKGEVIGTSGQFSIFHFHFTHDIRKEAIFKTNKGLCWYSAPGLERQTARPSIRHNPIVCIFPIELLSLIISSMVMYSSVRLRSKKLL